MVDGSSPFACLLLSSPLVFRYVFGGCSELLTNLLVRTLSHLQDKRVNQRGVAKICRNFFALQQNLNNIEGTAASSEAAASAAASQEAGLQLNSAQAMAMGPTAEAHLQESHFDRARQYYELLNYSQEELHLFQLENPDMFSADEYAALQTIHTQARNADGRFG